MKSTLKQKIKKCINWIYYKKYVNIIVFEVKIIHIKHHNYISYGKSYVEVEILYFCEEDYKSFWVNIY